MRAAAGSSADAIGDLNRAVESTLDKLKGQGFVRRLWDKDATLWKAEPEHQKIIRNALGWLTIGREMRVHVGEMRGCVNDVRKAGFRHAVLLGMGGSSLCPDVLRATFGTAPGYLDLQVLDSTVPASVSQVERNIDLERTLFIVSSKSGGTTETLSFYKYFYDRLQKVKGESAGNNFVAITDPGSGLEKLAREQRFRRIFPGAPDIGGRYSALSAFGLFPAALTGIDVASFLERAGRMEQACAAEPPAENPGVRLGVTMAEAAKAGRDKVTFVISPAIASFADWAEQLIAESTGKEGKGLVPVAGEALGEVSSYGHDRLFVRMKLASDAADTADQKLAELEKAGHPVVRITVASKLDLAQEFFRWEIATATAGALMGIDAFDQPNVQESKDNTKRLLEQYRQEKKLPAESAVLSAGGLEFFCDAGTFEELKEASNGAPSVEALLAAMGGLARSGDYVAIMAYTERTAEIEERLEAIRLGHRDALHMAATLGYGPRFLHSTGQLHKGGPNTGLFLQVTAADAEDLPVPGEPYSFSVLKQAQALGDLQSLQSKNRRVLHVHLGADVKAGLDRLLKAMHGAIAGGQSASA